MNLHQALFSKRLSEFVTLAISLLAFAFTCPAQTNSWTSAVSGNWQGSTWSLGIPPAAGQSVMITNAGYKAVGIFPMTPVNFTATMTVSNLTISGPGISLNTLLLNFFGTATPLKVLSNCAIGTNGRIISLNSGLQVNGDFSGFYGKFSQIGGVTVATNFEFFNSTVLLTNATLIFSNATLGGGVLVQNGGLVTGSNLLQTGSYELDGGLLSTLVLNTGTFNQFGGEVDSASTSSGNYSLSNGVLHSGSLFDDVGNFTQTGGQCTVTNDIFIAGIFEDYGPPLIGSYELRGGSLSCGSMSVLQIGFVDQVGGTNSVSGNLKLFPNSGFECYSLAGGLLATSNTIITNSLDSIFGIVTSLGQAGGVHRVTNSLLCYGLTGNASYLLSSGTLVAPNILVSGGQFAIGASPGVVINNQKSFALDGATLLLTNTTQSLAPLMLSGFQCAINFVSGNSRLRFADSSGQSWSNGVTLAILGWNGSLAGGGADQLFFGDDANDLTPDQVKQIEFVNPAGFVPGTWPAKILTTGEIVPTAVVPLSISLSGGNAVIQWPSPNFHLQVATNLAGPFQDFFAVSPYTNDITQFPQRFFRVAP
jgi:hypothetical protein